MNTTTTKAGELPLSKAALFSFVAMCINDLVLTAMVIFESQFNWAAAGVCDILGYIAGLVCSVFALDSILRDGWRSRRSLILVATISVANFVGTALGVLIVAHLTHHH